MSSKGIEPFVVKNQFFYRESPLPIGSPALNYFYIFLYLFILLYLFLKGKKLCKHLESNQDFFLKRETLSHQVLFTNNLRCLSFATLHSTLFEARLRLPPCGFAGVEWLRSALVRNGIA